MKFSIIIPIYNREKFIKNTVQSALEQTYSNIELICLDDASTDDSLNILKALQKKDSRIKIVEQAKNMGTHMARKVAVENASGDYVLFLDCDDALAINACDILNAELLKADSDIIAFAHEDNGLVRVPNSKLSAENLFENLVYDGHKTQAEIWAKCYKSNIVKKAFSQMQNFYSVMAEDVIEVIITAYHIKTYRAIPNVLYYYARNADGAINSKKTARSMEKYLVSEKNAIEALHDFFIDTADGEKIVYAVEKKLYEDTLDKIVHTLRLSDCKKVYESLARYFSKEVIESTEKKGKFTSPLGIVFICLYRFAKSLFYTMPQAFQVFCRSIKYKRLASKTIKV